MKIEKCPGCLKNGFNSYCNKCRNKLFDGRKVNHILNFSRTEFDKFKTENNKNISLPGKQFKHTLKIKDNELVLAGNVGEYIIKPVPSENFENREHAPANEHITMQIAEQVYKINCAVNGLIFFSGGEAAYITKRFDIRSGNNKFLQEDFAQISGRTEEINGRNYKYEFSYEKISELMKMHVKAYAVEIEKFFKIIIFNYLFSNNDFHLKNISLYRNEIYGDYLLTPFYDLSNTEIHFPDAKEPALRLFEDSINRTYSGQELLEFSAKIGIKEKRFAVLFNNMLSGSIKVERLISLSFLNESLKRNYWESYNKKADSLRKY